MQSTLSTFTPDPARDLFMNSGDRLAVTVHDTPDGLRIDINDLTTGQSGSMTSGAANGYGQVQYAPNPLDGVRQHPRQLPSHVQHLVRADARDLGSPLL